MPFVPDSNFEKKEKLDDFKKRIIQKKEQQYINDQAKEDEPKKPLKMDNAKIIKEVMKNTAMDHNRKQKPLTLKDLQKAVEMDKYIEEVKAEEVHDILKEEEVQDVKNEFINVLAMPHSNPVKRRIFANKLQESTTINNYVNNNVLLRIFNKANENIKFGLVYGMKYLQTNSDYDQLLMVQKLKLEQLEKEKKEQQNKPKEEIKEEIKVEKEEEKIEEEEEEE